MELLQKLAAGKNLSAGEAEAAMEGVISGSFTPAQAAGLLIALKMKGETLEEISEFAKVMRKHAVKIKPNAEMLVDTCGTGGDSLRTFNISTCAAIIASAAGASVAKHGNRSVSSSCGSADVLEQLGVKMLQPAEVEKCIESTGFGFMFAPFFHPAMKNVGSVRTELGVRTVFNILGPLTNPAGAQAQLLGVYDFSLAEKMAGVMKTLGTRHALVVNSEGMDEIGLGATKICELKSGNVEVHEISGKEFGFALREIPRVQAKEESAEIIRQVLSGKEGAARDVALLNAGAAVYAAGKAGSIAGGVKLAEKAVDSGKAESKLGQVVAFAGAC